jgi:hypothetical protein
VFLNFPSPKGFAVSKKLVLKSLAAVALAFPLLASAESQLTVGTGSAAAKLNFEIKIPRVLFLGVGSGAATPLSNNATVDLVSFDYTNNPLAVGTGPTGTANTISGNVVPVRVFGNNGQIVITATNPANLASGTDTIAFSEISATSSDTNLPAPALGGGTANPVLSGGSKVTVRNANWTFAYANNTQAAAGTYTGQVTYTATMP